MKYKSSHRDRQFVLEGRFSGFMPSSKKPFKYLRLTTANGEYCIKLPKYLQLDVVSHFALGDWVQLTGTWKEKSVGDVRFKADNLVRANPTSHGPSLLSSDLGGDRPPEHLAPLAPPSTECALADANPPSAEKSNVKILVCGKSKCMKQGGRAVCQRLEALLNENGLADHVTIKQTGCMDQCKHGPNLVFMPDKARYSNVKPEAVPELLRRHL